MNPNNIGDCFNNEDDGDSGGDNYHDSAGYIDGDGVTTWKMKLMLVAWGGVMATAMIDVDEMKMEWDESRCLRKQRRRLQEHDSLENALVMDDDPWNV